VAVWFEVNINSQYIGDVEIRRREKLDLGDQAAIQDVVSTYLVTLNGMHMGDVRHRYGDGVWRLIAIATEIIATPTTPT